MNLRDKARMLIDISEVHATERELDKMQQLAKQKGAPPSAQLFKSLHRRIYNILKYNYLPEFYKKVL